MRDPRTVDWEKRLKQVFDRIDEHLEARYGGRFPLHPARAARGHTANEESDGLFNVGASFSPGFGSKLGRGYVVNVRMVTLARVPSDLREAIEDEVAGLLRKELPRAFPGARLNVERDGPVYKIYGDLALGDA